MFGVEQALSGQTLAQLTEGQVQCPDAARLETPDNELISAFLGVDIDVARCNDFRALAKLEFDAADKQQQYRYQSRLFA